MIRRGGEGSPIVELLVVAVLFTALMLTAFSLVGENVLSRDSVEVLSRVLER